MKRYITNHEKDIMDIFQTLSFGSRQKLIELAGMAQTAELSIMEELRKDIAGMASQKNSKEKKGESMYATTKTKSKGA